MCHIDSLGNSGEKKKYEDQEKGIIIFSAGLMSITPQQAISVAIVDRVISVKSKNSPMSNAPKSYSLFNQIEFVVILVVN